MFKTKYRIIPSAYSSRHWDLELSVFPWGWLNLHTYDSIEKAENQIKQMIEHEITNAELTLISRRRKNTKPINYDKQGNRL